MFQINDSLGNKDFDQYVSGRESYEAVILLHQSQQYTIHMSSEYESIGFKKKKKKIKGINKRKRKENPTDVVKDFFFFL